MEPASPKDSSTTQTVARNSFWYGLETAFGIVTAFATSIAMARILGPQKLGYFNYVMWLANVSGLIGSLGIPLATRKYIAEYLGRGQTGFVRSLVYTGLGLQTALAAAITVTALVLVYTVSDPSQRHISAFQVASTLPSMMLAIPSQANLAAENMKANVAGSLVGQSLYIVFVAVSLWTGWDLFGIAVGIFVYRSVELLVRLLPVIGWVRQMPSAPLPTELRRKLATFSLQGTVLMLLNVIVWDRSDLVFLKMFGKDIGQVTFYAVSFNLVERALTIPQTFATAIGASLMAQYGRDERRLPQMVATSAKYILMCSIPLLLGMTALSGAVIQTLYGAQYEPAIPVLAVASTLAIARSLHLPGTQLMQATERQGFLVWWGCTCAGLNIALDLLLIPRYQATGAAAANGLAQAIAVAGVWVRAWRIFRLPLPAGAILRVAIAGVVMSLTVRQVVGVLGGWMALPAGVLAGAAVFVTMLRLTRAFDEEDRNRFLLLRRVMLVPLQGPFDRLVRWMIPLRAVSGRMEGA